MVYQKNILRLEIGVDEVEVVKECNGAQELSCERLDVRARKWYKATLLEEVEDTETEQWCDDADMSTPVEAFE